MNYADAKAQCASDGAGLPIPRSGLVSLFLNKQFNAISRKPFKDAENQFIASQFPEKDIWLGISDINTEGTWMAEDGSVLNYFNWNSGEPNNQGNEDAVHIYGNAGGKWNDVAESSLKNVVCVYAVPEFCIYATSGRGNNTLCDNPAWPGTPIAVNRNDYQVATFASEFTDQRVCISDLPLFFDLETDKVQLKSTDTDGVSKIFS